MPRRGKDRSQLYRRGSRWYADLREFRDVGGGIEALKPEGASYATTDRHEAERLLTARLQDLSRQRSQRTAVGQGKGAPRLAELARQHLIRKAETGRHADAWLRNLELYLSRAVKYFGATRDLETITVEDVFAWMRHLRTLRGRRGETMRDGTVRHHVMSLNNLYRFARRFGVRHSPVGDLMDGELPPISFGEGPYLEIHEAAALLEATRRHAHHHNGCPWLYELVATLLMTGARWSEVAGLDVEDVSFTRQRILIRPNRHRRTKTGRSWEVPLWPQLAEILRPHLTPLDRTPREGLVFPGRDGGMVTNINKGLDAVAARLGWDPGAIRTRIFRQTYTTARLQTLDNGEPVAVWTVAQELGHTTTRMLEKTYARLGLVRHRAAVVEFRIRQHGDRLADRFGEGVAKTLLQVGPGA